MSNYVMPNRGLNNLTPPKWLGLLSDAFLWLSLLLLAGVLIYLVWIMPQQAAQQTVTLSFRNANEVSRGAQVKMMGTEIGYVDKILIGKDHINVVVKTNPGGITIPAGSTFTINFTGLAGAKSIEVIPPDKPTNGRENPQGRYFVEEPIRMKDAMENQTKVAEGLKKGAENFADFFGKKQPIEELQHNIHVAYASMNSANQALTETKTTLNETERKADSGLNKIISVLNDFAISSDTIARTTGKDDFDTNVFHSLGSISRGLLKGQKQMAMFVEEKHLSRYQHTAGEMNEEFDRIARHITPTLWYAKWDNQNQKLARLSQLLTQAEHHLNPVLVNAQFKQARVFIQQLNHVVISTNKSLEVRANSKSKK